MTIQELYLIRRMLNIGELDDDEDAWTAREIVNREITLKEINPVTNKEYEWVKEVKGY